MARLKEMTAHIRKRLRVEGIGARVHMCGDSIKVSVPAYGLEFSDDEQRSIRFIAKCNRLTRTSGAEIDVERMTDPFEMEFHLPVEA